MGCLESRFCSGEEAKAYVVAVFIAKHEEDTRRILL